MKPGRDIKPRITITGDGSDTLFMPGLNEHYHSTFGAIRESQHVFIENGLLHAFRKFGREISGTAGSLNILEMGFGTGLNALMTQMEAEKHGTSVFYHTIETHPLTEETWSLLNYPRCFGSFDYSSVFSKLHHSAWSKPVVISHRFTLLKDHMAMEDLDVKKEYYHLVYFDAFGPEIQPELWTRDIFRKLGGALLRGGILVTYSVKGDVVRALRSCGFHTEKLSGPPGKRHILRATRE